MTLHKSLASAVALAVLIPGAALAHHGWSSYDAEKTLTVTGPLTDIAWRNPHGEAKIKYDGKTWAVVLAPVTLVGYPRKDGVAEMRIERVTVDGKTVELR
jgi:hypothetical protein